jgi:hypothetical protein
MAVRNSSTSSTNAADAWKADAFLNFSLPTKSGGKSKLGAISLKLSKEHQKQLIELFKADPAKVQEMAAKLIVDFQMATVSEENAFDI